jgi:hypothetical protein
MLSAPAAAPLPARDSLPRVAGRHGSGSGQGLTSCGFFLALVMQMLEVVRRRNRDARGAAAARREKGGIVMENSENLAAEVKKATGASGKIKAIIGTVSILAVAILAGLVFRSYEAGIPPAELAPTSASTRFIPVSISEQNPANEMESIPGHAPQAGPGQMPSMKPASL